MLIFLLPLIYRRKEVPVYMDGLQSRNVDSYIRYMPQIPGTIFGT